MDPSIVIYSDAKIEPREIRSFTTSLSNDIHYGQRNNVSLMKYTTAQLLADVASQSKASQA